MGGADGGLAGIAVGDLVTLIDQLDGGKRAVCVDRVHHARQRRDVPVVPQISHSWVETTAQPPSALTPRMAASALG
jgi:hypothetical protein